MIRDVVKDLKCADLLIADARDLLQAFTEHAALGTAVPTEKLFEARILCNSLNNFSRREEVKPEHVDEHTITELPK